MDSGPFTCIEPRRGYSYACLVYLGGQQRSRGARTDLWAEALRARRWSVGVVSGRARGNAAKIAYLIRVAPHRVLRAFQNYDSVISHAYKRYVRGGFRRT